MRPVGFSAPIARHNISCAAPHHTSFLSERAGRDQRDIGARIEESFPSSYAPGEGDVDHLVFALKYDGVELSPS